MNPVYIAERDIFDNVTKDALKNFCVNSPIVICPDHLKNLWPILKFDVRDQDYNEFKRLMKEEGIYPIQVH